MKKSFRKLYQEVTKKRVLKEKEGLELKNFSPLLETTLLFPILNLEDEGIDTRKDFDLNLLEELYEIYKEFKENKLFRKILIGADKDKAFEIIKNEVDIYDRGVFATKIFENEIHFTVKKDRYKTDMLISDEDNLDASLIGIMDDNYNFSNNRLRETVDNNIYSIFNIKEMTGLWGISRDLFYTLFDQYGFIEHELYYLSIVDSLKTINKEQVAIDYANSKFIKSYYEKHLRMPKSLYSIDDKLFNRDFINLLKDYDILILKDMDIKEAIKIYKVEKKRI